VEAAGAREQVAEGGGAQGAVGQVQLREARGQEGEGGARITGYEEGGEGVVTQVLAGGEAEGAQGGAAAEHRVQRLHLRPAKRGERLIRGTLYV
jgi:hypothetical protein